MNGAHGFQFTPIGIIRGDQAAPAASADGAPATVPVVPSLEGLDIEPYRPLSSRALAASPQPIAPPAPLNLAGQALNQKHIVRQCKDRIRELEKALRSVPAMQAELESLKRLVQAASPKAARIVKLAKRQAGTTGNGDMQ